MIVTESTRAAALASAGQANNPFVFWDNLAAAATLGGTATLADGDRANAVSGTTFDYWLPDVTATTAQLSADLGSAATLSCMALAGHNLADLGASIQARRSTDGSSWSDAGAGVHTPTDNRPIIFRLPTSGQDAQHWQFYITGLTAGDALAAAVFFAGNEMVMPQRFYQSFSPVLTPTEVALQSNVSQGGNLLGSAVVFQGATIDVSIEDLEDTFVRGAEWLAFQAAFNRGSPAFFGWRPTKYPEDAHYLWREGNVLRPQPSGRRAMMNVAFSARVYEG